MEYPDSGSGRLLGEQSLKGRAQRVGVKSEVRGSSVGRAEGKPLPAPAAGHGGPTVFCIDQARTVHRNPNVKKKKKKANAS